MKIKDGNMDSANNIDFRILLSEKRCILAAMIDNSSQEPPNRWDKLNESVMVDNALDIEVFVLPYS